MPLSPEAQAARAELDSRRQAEHADMLEGRRPLVPSRFGRPESRGTIVMLAPGWRCRAWDDLRGVRDSLDYPAGGTIINVVDKSTVDDDGTIDVRRAFYLIDHEAARSRGIVRHVLVEAQIDSATIDLPDRYQIWRLIVRLAEALVDVTCHGGRIDLTRDEDRLLSLVDDIRRLAVCCRLDTT
jgi:hypothetical protein